MPSHCRVWWHTAVLAAVVGTFRLLSSLALTERNNNTDPLSRIGDQWLNSNLICACYYVPTEPVPVKSIANPFAVQRPHATESMLERQYSFRGFEKLSETSPFKRQFSLRLNELPSTLERQQQLVKQNSQPNGPGRWPDESSVVPTMTFCITYLLCSCRWL